MVAVNTSTTVIRYCSQPFPNLVFRPNRSITRNSTMWDR